MNLLDQPPQAAAQVVAGWVAAHAHPRYRTRQIVSRLWQRPVGAWSQATELPRALRDELDMTFPIARPAQLARQESRDGTVKFLWGFGSHGAVESVLIPEGRRRTLCISSQAGCAFGCVFCATGRMGFVRHLAPWEITAQVREMLLDPRCGRPSNIVFMGMGEPLHNWEAVNDALTILNDPEGLAIGARHITVSTVGVVPGLKLLAARPEQFRVALSLHAPTSGLRRTLMPVERKYPLRDVLQALTSFPRRVTFEYVLIAGINDADDAAVELARIALPLEAHVNLLPLHPGGAPGYEPVPRTQMQAFARVLRERGVNVTVRRSRGLDIAAACGQLRVESERSGRVAAHIDGRIDE